MPPGLTEVAVTTQRNRNVKFPQSKGNQMGKKAVANVTAKNAKSSLVSEHGFGHKDQGDGHSVGNAWTHPRKSEAGGPAKGTKKGGDRGNNSPMANAPKQNVKSSLASEHGHGHEGQPDGHSIGTGQAKAMIRGMPHGGDRHTFKPPPMTNAHGFGHAAHQRSGPHRLSGVAGAHRLGSRNK